MTGLACAAAAALGASAGLALGPSDGHAPLLAAAVAVGVLALVRDRAVRVVVLAAAVGLGAGASMQRALDGLVHHALPRHGTATVRAAVAGDPDASRFSARVLVRVEAVDGRPVDDRIVLVRAGGGVAQRIARLQTGDRVELRGSFGPLTGFDARRRWEHAVACFRAIELADFEPASSPWWRVANGARDVIVRGVRSLPGTERALMLGFLLGDTRALPKHVVDDFRAAGLSHLLAVSGANLAFLFAAVDPLISRFGRRLRLAAVLGVVLCFGAMTRWEPSVLRASVMVGVALVARHVGRPQLPPQVIGIAVAALLVADPFLIARVGFLLSVGACLGLVFVTPWLRARLRLPSVVNDAVSTTGGAIVATAPVQLAVFGRVPLVAIPANLLAGASAAALTVWGLVAGVAAGVAPALGTAVHLPSVVLLRSQLAIAAIAARHPLAVDRRLVVAAVTLTATAAAVRRR